MSFSKLFYLVPFLISSFIFSDCTDDVDVCFSLDGGNLNYESSQDMYGFQFSHTGCVTDADGGDGGDTFTISTSPSTVLAFDFGGAFLPAGGGTLIILEGNVSADCLSDFVVSGAGGTNLSWEFDSGETSDDDGCIDIFALNYDSDAVNDDGSCIYADHQIEAGMMYYLPENLTINVGESVQWNNVDGLHDVVATDGSFSFNTCTGPCIIGSHTFDMEGTYDYICSVGNHAAAGMVGAITVVDTVSDDGGDDGGMTGDNILWISDAQVDAGEITTLNINLDNPYDAVAGFQLYLSDFPNSYGSFLDINTTDRTSTFTVQANEQPDGSYIILGFELNGGNIASGDGPILTLDYQ